MKFTPALRLLALSIASAGCASAFSLYDTMPAVGLSESSALSYSATVSLGYDDNVNATSSNEEDSLYSYFSVSAAYADVDAVTEIKWDARLGGMLYSEDADNTTDNFFADVALGLTISHDIDKRSNNDLVLRLSYTPELDYANGISAANRQGNSLNWTVRDTYSRILDSRLTNKYIIGYSGNIYTEDAYSIDDREYITFGTSLNYKTSEINTYVLSLSSQLDYRRYGYDSQNIFLNVGINKSLSIYSALSAGIGAQCKFIDDETNLYPTLRFNYRHQLEEKTSATVYLSYQNENIDTFISETGSNYLSNMTWRIGGSLNRQLTHVWSANCGVSALLASYSDGQNGLQDRDQNTFNLNVGVSYKITESLFASGNYSYTIANRDAGDYDRNRISGSLNYKF